MVGLWHALTGCAEELVLDESRLVPIDAALTNDQGVTVFFDPDTNDVLGFSIANFSKYYEENVKDDGEFEVVLPARVPANLEEEMDFDEETIKNNVRIAEIY